MYEGWRRKIDNIDVCIEAAPTQYDMRSIIGDVAASVLQKLSRKNLETDKQFMVMYGAL